MADKKSTSDRIEKAVTDYLLWMIEKGYADITRRQYRQVLKHFSCFIARRGIEWDAVFTFAVLKDFQKESGLYHAAKVINGLSGYLLRHGMISCSIKKPTHPLPEVFQQYLAYYIRIKNVSHPQTLRTRKTLAAFADFTDRKNIELKSILIEQIDAFLAAYNKGYTKETHGTRRSILRGFLTWLYQNKILKRNCAPLIIGAPVFAHSRPPKFLRPDEIKSLFESLTGSTPMELRTAAMVHMGCYLGLRPIEISRIRLDDIEFKKQEICIPDRKNTNPARLPLPECCIKTVAAYILGGRPKTDNRRLFITNRVPYRPVFPATISRNITAAMKKAGLSSSAYWLRHTYAQNLLEADVSFFEIKEMMGHDSMQTTRRYIHVHTKLMREVLFDDDDF